MEMKKIILASCAAVAVVAAVYAAKPSDNALEQTAEEYTAGCRAGGLEDFTHAAEQTVNGVVSVKSYASPRQRQQQSIPFDDPIFEFFFGVPRQYQQPQQPQEPKSQQIGLGSGVIISGDGYIVTNNHVIEHADRLEVTLNDNRNFEATVVGADPNSDLALLKIDAPDLHVIRMGDSEKLHVGEWVLAVGNPFGFTSSVTSGIVSAKARNISSTMGGKSNGIESYIQTDAAVNSGNSGGALVNLKGELVGINTAIYSQTGAYAGVSFAIPTTIVSKVVDDLKKYGSVQRAFLGIAFSELSPELIAEKKIEGTNSGIYIGQIFERSAALKAGLAEGDVIVALDGAPIRSTAELQEAVARHSPGDKVKIEYYRDGRRYSTMLTLHNNQGGITVAAQSDESALGATLANVTDEQKSMLGIKGGVAVSDVREDGLLAKAGIRSGFIMLSVNGQRIANPEAFTKLYKAVLNSGDDTDKVLFVTGLYPSGKTAYYAVGLEP